MYFIANGMLEAADINPQLAGSTTLDKTNPRIAQQQKQEVETTAQIASGQVIKKTSPLVFFAAAAGALVILGYLQRKSA